MQTMSIFLPHKTNQMQILKDDIRKDILEKSEILFLQKGFLKTSMREVSKLSGVGVSNLYNYFPSKDQLFCEVVRPVTQAFKQMLDEHHGRRGRDIMDMQSKDYFLYVVDEYLDLLMRHRKRLELLLFRAQGSSLENFRKDYADQSTSVFKAYLMEMKQKHPELNIRISDFYIHLHTIWMFDLLEEMIRQKVEPEHTRQIITEYMTGEIFGWRELMNV